MYKNHMTEVITMKISRISKKYIRASGAVAVATGIITSIPVAIISRSLDDGIAWFTTWVMIAIVLLMVNGLLTVYFWLGGYNE